MTREDCRKIIEPLLTPERLYHSECVADAAIALAKRYGADEAQAMRAGMLHDCMKCASKEQQRAMCERIRPMRPEDMGCKPIWHAFAGAAYLQLECGVTDDEILNAVRWHTTGHANITLLEEIVFVADLVSAERNYPDVERVHALSKQNLHAASKYILEFIFAKERQSGRKPHPNSLAWYSQLKEN